MKGYGLAVYADIGDVAAGPDHARAHLEALGHADGHVGAQPVGEVGDQLLGGLAGVGHGIGTELPGRGDRGEPDRAGTDHCDGVARPYLPVEHAHFVGGREDVGQQDGVLGFERARRSACGTRTYSAWVPSIR